MRASHEAGRSRPGSIPDRRVTPSADVVIAGGAAIGSSIAYHLAADPTFDGRIVVVEKDPTYRFSASALSAASIRQQFSSPVNIRISLYGIAFMRAIGDHLVVEGERPAIDLHEGGYLYLGGDEGAKILAENQSLQTAEGADILLLDHDALAHRFPWLALDGVVAGTWGRSGEGWYDGWGLMQAFRKKARSLGVTYVDGEVVAVEKTGDRVTAVVLKDGARIACGALVNAAGASGGRRLAAASGIDIPVFARKRCVFAFHCRGDVTKRTIADRRVGLLVPARRPAGPEGQLLFICGGGPAGQETGDAEDFEVDWSLFEDIYWPTLAERVPAFESIKPGRAWAGHYDMNELDHNAIVGRAVGTSNLYLANGFSGHGLQQSPAVGRGLAELIAHGRYMTLDLSDLGHERVVEGRPLLERNVI